MANDRRWCFAWFQGKPAVAWSARGALQRTTLWSRDDVIRVGFLGGDERLKRRVRDASQQWMSAGNLRVVFVDGAQADVRIDFRPGNGSWSTIGTTCRHVPKEFPTMNFGWLDAGCSEQELRSVVLHEFGHVLGLVHQHQNPAAAISWNRAAVMRDLLEPAHCWSIDDIEHNVFNPIKPDMGATSVDQESIMAPVIPASWTTNGFSIDFNTGLSEQDKRLIRSVYG